MDRPHWGVSRALLGRMHTLCRLQELSIQIAADEAPLLARLPPSLTKLCVSVALRRGRDGSFVWEHEGGQRFDVCPVLEAVAGGLQLQTLFFSTSAAAPFQPVALARLVHGGALASLRELCLGRPWVTLGDVSVLAALPRLKRLVVNPKGWSAADPLAQSVVAAHAARGLRIAALHDGPPPHWG